MDKHSRRTEKNSGIYLKIGEKIYEFISQYSNKRANKTVHIGTLIEIRNPDFEIGERTDIPTDSGFSPEPGKSYCLKEIKVSGDESYADPVTREYRDLFVYPGMYLRKLLFIQKYESGGGQVFLSLEECLPSLKDKLSEFGGDTVKKLKIFSRVCEGLLELYSFGFNGDSGYSEYKIIAHRDLKTENILIDEGGGEGEYDPKIKIIDFSSLKIVSMANGGADAPGAEKFFTDYLGLPMVSGGMTFSAARQVMSCDNTPPELSRYGDLRGENFDNYGLGMILLHLFSNRSAPFFDKYFCEVTLAGLIPEDQGEDWLVDILKERNAELEDVFEGMSLIYTEDKKTSLLDVFKGLTSYNPGRRMTVEDAKKAAEMMILKEYNMNFIRCENVVLLDASVSGIQFSAFYGSVLIKRKDALSGNFAVVAYRGTEEGENIEAFDFSSGRWVSEVSPDSVIVNSDINETLRVIADPSFYRDGGSISNTGQALLFVKETFSGIQNIFFFTDDLAAASCVSKGETILFGKLLDFFLPDVSFVIPRSHDGAKEFDKYGGDRVEFFDISDAELHSVEMSIGNMRAYSRRYMYPYLGGTSSGYGPFPEEGGDVSLQYLKHGAASAVLKSEGIYAEKKEKSCVLTLSRFEKEICERCEANKKRTGRNDIKTLLSVLYTSYDLIGNFQKNGVISGGFDSDNVLIFRKSGIVSDIGFQSLGKLMVRRNSAAHKNFLGYAEAHADEGKKLREAIDKSVFDDGQFEILRGYEMRAFVSLMYGIFSRIAVSSPMFRYGRLFSEASALAEAVWGAPSGYIPGSEIRTFFEDDVYSPELLTDTEVSVRGIRYENHADKAPESSRHERKPSAEENPKPDAGEKPKAEPKNEESGGGLSENKRREIELLTSKWKLK